MSAIRLNTIINSDTLHLPELRPLIGHSVEIIVVDQGFSNADSNDAFWKKLTVDEIAKSQVNEPSASTELVTGDWSDEDFASFEQAVETWRNSGRPFRGADE